MPIWVKLAITISFQKHFKVTGWIYNRSITSIKFIPLKKPSSPIEKIHSIYREVSKKKCWACFVDISDSTLFIFSLEEKKFNKLNRAKSLLMTNDTELKSLTGNKWHLKKRWQFFLVLNRCVGMQKTPLVWQSTVTSYECLWSKCVTEHLHLLIRPGKKSWLN